MAVWENADPQTGVSEATLIYSDVEIEFLCRIINYIEADYYFFYLNIIVQLEFLLCFLWEPLFESWLSSNIIYSYACHPIIIQFNL